MKKLFIILFLLLFFVPKQGYSLKIQIPQLNVDIDPPQLSSYYDLRDRKTYIQVTNTTDITRTIHVQIFQNDRNCDELDFFDNLTPNDTVVYDLDNIIKNDGSAAPINLLDNSDGYIVISDLDIDVDSSLIGNFRIIDDSGYEYRANMAGFSTSDTFDPFFSPFIANFNTVGGANQADVVAYAYDGAGTSSVMNLDNGISFDIFVYDLDEDPLSCDNRVFACGAVMNYGINEDFGSSKGNDLLCPGGGLANPQGGVISFENFQFVLSQNESSFRVFVGLIGINNGNGTGSMDYWIFQQPQIG
ncbi:MAG: hypothetical protein GTO02_04560 [Candidatus Dadabacteria bacterium]|nr:hypothetical protein [Candidatus Dadabacteria bacterium]NIQ13687.1 hypothetical protein [Candidatus Dadabacteria bacterium]